MDFWKEDHRGEEPLHHIRSGVHDAHVTLALVMSVPSHGHGGVGQISPLLSYCFSLFVLDFVEANY